MSPPTRISVLRRGFARVWPLFAWPPRPRLSREGELARAFEDLADGDDDYLREVAEYLRRQRPFSRGS